MDSQPNAILIYIIIVLFYCVLFQFVFVRAMSSAPSGYILKTYLVMCAGTALYNMYMAVSVVLAVGIYYVLLNDGFQVGISVPGPLVSVLGLERRTEFWLINPILLFLPVVQICVLSFNSVWRRDSDPIADPAVHRGEGAGHGRVELSLSPRGQIVIGTISLCIVASMALFMLDCDEVVYVDTCVEQAQSAEMAMTKVLAALIYAAAFFTAYWIAKKIDGKGIITMILGVFFFGLFGSIAGAILFGIRSTWTDGSMASVHLNLVWMHAVSFMIAFLSLVLASRVMPSSLARLFNPIFTVRPR